MEKQKIEVLAPAGSYDCFRAAIAAGADAVYGGGARFGARAFADNFTQDQLLLAIDEAHIHGRRFYLTVNTLVKDEEFGKLEHMLRPLYENGLDAVIVQDVGVFDFVKSFFPGLELHVSTQMTITGVQGAQFWKERGAVRVVPARELSLEEIRDMKASTGMEIECFVHGALCYCYSGQCLFSSLIGGRSGNRGQCAQPCRLPYTAGGKTGYLLSMKDLCALDLIPELAEAGIDSFKIEGRMKRPEYVAGVTAIYRKYTDLYLEKGKNGYRVDPKDREILLDLFNRGGFHTGYYHQHNGRTMIAFDRPNHAGVPVVKILSQKGREIYVRAVSMIHRGDVLEFPGKRDNYTFGRDQKPGDVFSIPVSRGTQVVPDSFLNRIHNRELLQEISQTYLFGKNQEKVYGFLKLSPGKSAKLVLCCREVWAEAQSKVPVQKAQTHPLSEDVLRRQIQKTGNTIFVFDRLDIEMQGEVFLPLQQINDLRREALECLEARITGAYHRTENPPAFIKECAEKQIEEAVSSQEAALSYVSALVQTKEQLSCIEQFPEISRVYVDSHIEGGLFYDEASLSLCEKLRQKGRKVMIALPYIFREKTAARFEALWEAKVFRSFDGVLLRNYESVFFFQEKHYDREMILDGNMYVMNRRAQQFWKKRKLAQFTLPFELNQREWKALDLTDAEMVVYGHIPVMISAQCLAKTVDGCRKQSGALELKDRGNRLFPTKNFCEDCYNIIYNSVPLCLFDQPELTKRGDPGGYRLQFSVENGEQTKQILQQFVSVFFKGEAWTPPRQGFTRGHYKRGIT